MKGPVGNAIQGDDPYMYFTMYKYQPVGSTIIMRLSYFDCALAIQNSRDRVHGESKYKHDSADL